MQFTIMEKPELMKSKLFCPECKSKLFIKYLNEKYRRKSPVYFCKKCKKELISPQGVSIIERKLKHKELLETYKFVMIAILGTFAAITIAIVRGDIDLGKSYLLLFFVIGLYPILLSWIIFESFFRRLRREIEILEVSKYDE